jgi:hypothetical protein
VALEERQAEVLIEHADLDADGSGLGYKEGVREAMKSFTNGRP